MIESALQIRQIFERSFTIPSLADEIFKAYGFAHNMPKSQITDRILSFLTDIKFSYPVHCARKTLTTQQPSSTDVGDQPTPKIYHSTTVQSYKIKFGNPFQGPNFQVAQHCVELIYLFDAFHDHLELVDQERLRLLGSDWEGALAALKEIAG